MKTFCPFLKKRLPGVGSEPGSSQFHLFSHFHHFTADPQRLKKRFVVYDLQYLSIKLTPDLITSSQHKRPTYDTIPYFGIWQVTNFLTLTCLRGAKQIDQLFMSHM
jgi:hypothetical protein